MLLVKVFFKRYLFLGLLAGLLFISCNQVKPPKPLGPVPNDNQLRWQHMEYYAFVHFSLNTYTDQSWGFGDEDVNLFNPEKLDCHQWARICKEAGMKGIIITAKHHCGFCLWPSEYTEYSVKNAPWKNGKGDVVREMADACKEYGLKLGVYLSPWDRNHPDYGKPEYITYFRNQLKELLTKYGDIFEVWFDGANGGDGYYGGANEYRKIDRTTYYDWKPTYKMIRELQPNIVIWNDGGDRGDLRWVGTEAGYVGETNWSLLDSTGKVTNDMLRYGKEDGNAWVAGEVNTSIRPEWFYHVSEDSKVKTLPELMDIYYNSIGRNGTLLLNFPIMPNGLIHEKDEKAALDFAKAVKEVFAHNLVEKATVSATNVRGKSSRYDAYRAIDGDNETYWTLDDGVTKASLTINFGKPTAVNRFMVQEYIKLGQRVKSFTIEALVGDQWQELAQETTIGYKRILCFPTVETTKLRFNILDSKACPVISNIGVYNAPQILTSPAIVREKSGNIRIVPADPESIIYFTTNDEDPTVNSTRYSGPIPLNKGKVNIRAIAYDPSSGKSSAAAIEQFDIPRKLWKILGIEDEKAAAVIDGDINTAWKHPEGTSIPADLVIDLGRMENLVGFKYHPNQELRKPGIISRYQFFVSQNNKDWKLVSEGEFSNIKNNPLWQTKTFELQKSRYIKLRALKNTTGSNHIGYGEFDVITK